MNLIATYNEKRIKSYRRFDLYEDKISVHIDFLFGLKSEFNIPLKDLKTEPDKIFHKAFNPILYLTGFAICIASIFLMALLMDKSKGYAGFLFPGSIIIFIIIIYLNPKRDEYSSFSYHSGIPAFDVGYLGKYKADYPPFIELVKKQIKKINSEQNESPD